jgi:Transposase DDE domain
MTTAIQSVIKNISEVTPIVSRKIALHVALIITTPGRKNYASMAAANNIPYGRSFIKKNDVADFLNESEKYLRGLIKRFATKEKPGYLIVDFSLLAKQFSEYIPGVTYDYDGVGKRVSKGFSAAFIFWSNGKITIPFDFALWHRKKDAGALYKKKTDLTKELILFAKKHDIPFNEVKLDGAFPSIEMLKFLIQEGIHLTMRMPSNRVISTEKHTAQLAEHPELKLSRNQKYKTIYACYKGIFCYFTAHKRKGKNGTKEVVFIISDVERSAKKHVESYAERWPGEKYFRTGKQHLGLTHCQSTNPEKQRLHIFLVMTSYAVLGLKRIDKRKKSIEEVLHPIRRQKSTKDLLAYIDLEATLMN